MGLATSQVRLLALTSRKADVEFKMQLASKRKTMLSREATQLSKLYYAKLNNAKIQYATGNGYADLNYNYLMGYANNAFVTEIVNGGSSFDKKNVKSMILTDNFGRVILDDDMMDIMLKVMNDAAVYNSDATVKSLTLAALHYLLMDSKDTEDFPNNNITGQGLTAGELFQSDNGVATKYRELYSSNTPALELLLLNGYKYGGTLYKMDDDFYSGLTYNIDSDNHEQILDINSKVMSFNKGYFYTLKGCTNVHNFDNTLSPYGLKDAFCIDTAPNLSSFKQINPTVAKQIVNLMEYYGSMFSAAFNGRGKLEDSENDLHHFNVSAKIKKVNGKYVLDENSTYETVTDVNKLQDGLRSGIYQLVNIASPVTGGYRPGQDLMYFESQNQLVEHIDNDQRESVTAWYNAARADLNSKESYWDSEVTELSAELNAITTEIDSVKSLRKDAISSTFKWGSA